LKVERHKSNTVLVSLVLFLPKFEVNVKISQTTLNSKYWRTTGRVL